MSETPRPDTQLGSQPRGLSQMSHGTRRVGTGLLTQHPRILLFPKRAAPQGAARLPSPPLPVPPFSSPQSPRGPEAAVAAVTAEPSPRGAAAAMVPSKGRAARGSRAAPGTVGAAAEGAGGEGRRPRPRPLRAAVSGLRARSPRGQGARPRGVPGSGLGAAAGEPLGPVPEAGGGAAAGEGRAVVRSPSDRVTDNAGAFSCLRARVCVVFYPTKHPR